MTAQEKIDLMCAQAQKVIAEFINRSAAQHTRRWLETLRTSK